MYLFSDACPTDWLVEGQDDTWHTIANFAFQSDPTQQALIEAGVPPAEILAADSVYETLVRALQAELPSKLLRKWRTGPGYRERFSRSLRQAANTNELTISGCSFQEKTLRNSKPALLASYNQHLRGIDGRGIGFEEWIDDRKHRRMKHSFMNFTGHHEIGGREEQILILLLMAWFTVDQFIFHSKRLAADPRSGFDRLTMTVVSDRLSGDNNMRTTMELNLRRLIDPADETAPIVLTRSPVSDTFSGDLIVDNLAGFLNAAVSDPSSVFADAVRESVTTGAWSGWHILQESGTALKSTPAIGRLIGIDAG